MLLRPVALFLGFVLLGLPAAGAPCQSCHQAEASLHARTRMASAMVPVLESAFAQNADKLLLHEEGGGYQFIYQNKPTGLRVISYSAQDNAVGQVRWVLGAGAQGQTPIVQWGENFYESRVSFFPKLHQYGITVGQDAAASPSASAALGHRKTRAQIFECLNCHSSVNNISFTDIRPGVQCERCHAGAERHSEGGKSAVVNPAKMSAPDQVRLCGTCHRNAPPVDDTQLENVRFQPLRLMKSRCFLKGNIECTTCHVAHADARRADPTFYDSRCVSCHTASHLATAQRVSGACITCHMPQIELHPALRFTDHFIRIVKTTDYPAGRIVARNGDQATPALHP